MFKKVLIANRGEIAVRIIRTCREMGIKTVAVYSEVDKTALHVLEADEAVGSGFGGAESQSYLNIDRLLAAARKTGAEAIHPGYGFLAENPVFAERCQQAGVVFIGPPAQAIRDLGNKTVARTIMSRAGVPVIPGLLPDFRGPSGLFPGSRAPGLSGHHQGRRRRRRQGHADRLRSGRFGGGLSLL